MKKLFDVPVRTILELKKGQELWLHKEHQLVVFDELSNLGVVVWVKITNGEGLNYPYVISFEARSGSKLGVFETELSIKDSIGFYSAKELALKTKKIETQVREHVQKVGQKYVDHMNWYIKRMESHREILGSLGFKTYFPNGSKNGTV